MYMPTIKELIKVVALYLRKSRDENQEDALVKHRGRLQRLCKERGWIIKDVYEEIITGAKLEKRTEMQKLLESLHLYDAVVVIDLDRLGRGNMKEWGEVLEAFKVNNTLVAIPGAIYNPNDPNDEFVMNIGGTVAHHEYRKITSRFYEGKVEGARLGKWTNGKPPYGYKYVKVIRNINGKDIVEGQVEIHPEQAPIYRMIIDMFIQDQKTTQQITEFLNIHGYKSPGGGLWYNNAVHRVLIDEFHLGKTIFGKTKGRWDKSTQSGVEKKPRSEWIVGPEGSHPPLKTQDEHDSILLILARNRRRPVAARKGTYPLSGLLYCKKCGHRMRFYQRKTTSGESVVYAKCDYYGPFGKTCEQPGSKLTDEFYENILLEIKNSFLNPAHLAKVNEQESIWKRKIEEISLLEREIIQKKKSKEKAEKLYLDGIEDVNFYKRYKKKFDAEIAEMTSRLRALTAEVDNITLVTSEELNEQAQKFLKDWSKATTNQERNALFSSIISKIWYNRDSETGEIELEIEYL